MLRLFCFYHYPEILGDILNELSRTSAEKIGELVIILSAGYFVLEGLVIKILAVKYDPEFSLAQGTSCAYYCCFYKMITFGSGGGIAEIYYLNKRGVPAAKATGMDLVQYMLQRMSIVVYGLLCVLVFFKDVKEPLEGYKSIPSDRKPYGYRRRWRAYCCRNF